MLEQLNEQIFTFIAVDKILDYASMYILVSFPNILQPSHECTLR